MVGPPVGWLRKRTPGGVGCDKFVRLDGFAKRHLSRRRGRARSAAPTLSMPPTPETVWIASGARTIELVTRQRLPNTLPPHLFLAISSQFVYMQAVALLRFSSSPVRPPGR